MQHLDYAYAAGMIEDFCQVGELFLTIRGRKYTPPFSFKVGTSTIHQQSVQTEVDAGYEGENNLVLIEGKNTGVNEVIIRQLYYPYRKWTEDISVEHGKKSYRFFSKKEVLNICSGCMNLQMKKITIVSN